LLRGKPEDLPVHLRVASVSGGKGPQFESGSKHQIKKVRISRTFLIRALLLLVLSPYFYLVWEVSV
jgi:hypothetical protein